MKKTLDFSVYDNWKYIKSKAISNNGEWLLYESNPYKDDGKITIYNSLYKQNLEIAKYSANSDFLVFKLYPYADTLRALKLKRQIRISYKDSLGILILGNSEIRKIENIKSFNIPKKESYWLAYIHNIFQKTQQKKRTSKTNMPSFYYISNYLALK